MIAILTFCLNLEKIVRGNGIDSLAVELLAQLTLAGTEYPAPLNFSAYLFKTESHGSIFY